ncbi:MAG: Cna B-type domain-containing protein, partial [Eubacterium sp.]|nr:Cna B-type domain-containing protein [Eubacterium sp.]
MNRKRQEENLRKKFNRIVSLICAVVLLFGSVQIASPVTAFADQNSEVAAQSDTQVESVDESQKDAQDDTNPVSDASAQNEIQTETQSVSQVPAEDQTEAALSEAGTQFTKDVASLNWDEIQKTREEKFKADSALIHNSEDAEAQSAAASADSNMKQVQEKLTALQNTYQALSDTDRADESVQNAEETLNSITEKLSTFEKEYFEKRVKAFSKSEENANSEADKDSASYQADLNSLKAIYEALSDEQKEDTEVKEAYKILQGFLGDEAAVSDQKTETASEGEKTEEPAAEKAKPAALAMKAPAPVSDQSITGSIACKDELAKSVLFDTVNDTDFFQFQVTVTKEDGTTKEYTTSLSSQDCHASVDFDYNFTITGISLADTDTVTVTCVPNSSISGYLFTSNDSTFTLKDGKWDAGKLTLSIDEVAVTINDVALGDDTGNTLYSDGSCTMDDGLGHKYSRDIAFWWNGQPRRLAMPKGASFSINAKRDGYILSTLSSSEIKRTDNETNKGSVPDTTIENNVSYDFVWVKKAADEESTFTKTWLDDGTNTATHENTPNLVRLQYKVDSDGGEWKDVNESALKVPSGSIAKTSKANGNKSVYTLSYTGLPEYLAGMDENGNYTKQKISYRIDERSVPSGYSKENNGQNLVNTKEYTLQATINWKDSNNAEGVRPAADEIKDLIQVYNGENSDQELVPVDPNNIVVTDNGNGSYTVFVHGLPSYNGSMDSPNTYYIKAFNISDRKASDGQNVQYSTVISNKSGVHENSQDAWNGATITCTISKKMDFSATKKWEDLFPSLRPKAQLGLYRYTSSPQNMELVSVTDTPNEGIKGGNDYPVRFQNLDAYDKNGNQYTYVVKETIPASDNGNYQAIYQDAEGNENAVGCPNGGTILNKNVKNTTSIYVRKHWVAKGTTLKVAGYTVRVGLKRYTNNPENAEIVKDVSGKPWVQSISGFADYNDLTSGTTFSDLPMTDKDGNFYTYVPYEVSETNYIPKGAEDGTLDQGDAFTIKDKDSKGEYDTYQITQVTSADCSKPMTRTRVAEITNTLGGTIRFVLSKRWVNAPKKTSVQYAIHRVDPYGQETVLDKDRQTWVPLADAKKTYTGELSGKPDEKDWGSTDTGIVLPLYDENSSRYTYFIDEVNDSSRHFFDYTLSQDEEGRADLVESVYMRNHNYDGVVDGQNMNVDLYKTWVDGGDTSTRRPVVIKVFRKDKEGKIDRPEDWDKKKIGVYTLSADNGWHVTNLLELSKSDLNTYFGEEGKDGTRTLIDDKNKVRTFDNQLSKAIVYREVKVGDTDVPAGDNCSYDSYTTTLISENNVEVTQSYKVTYAGDNDSRVKNIKQGSVVYEINSKWYDGHYLKGRPDVTFNITRDGVQYATCVVTVDKNGEVSTNVKIDGKDAVKGKDYSFALGDNGSLNDYVLTFNDFPLYNVDAGTRYEYACTESLPSESGYINNSPLDPGFPRTTTGAAGKNKENLKITTSFRNRRVDQSEKISYTKIWKDNSNSENMRPEVKLNLAARVKSASQIQKAGGEEDKLDLIPISGDTYMEAVSGKKNTYTYTFAQSMPKYVTKDLVNASNGALTDGDIG